MTSEYGVGIYNAPLLRCSVYVPQTNCLQNISHSVIIVFLRGGGGGNVIEIQSGINYVMKAGIKDKYNLCNTPHDRGYSGLSNYIICTFKHFQIFPFKLEGEG